MSACAPIATIPHTPAQTPESWLRIQPFVELTVAARTIVLVQPSSTLIVYALGLVAMLAGLRFLRRRDGHRTRLWWGVALLLWGAGALAAGTSYEAFSYHIKCAGRPACAWTSWWEVWYLLLSMASVDAIVMAQAYARETARGEARQRWYAVAHFASYVLLIAVGTQWPSRFLLSFEMHLLAAVPSAVLCVAASVRRHAAWRSARDRALLGAWAGLAASIVAYYGYFLSGLTERLWARGVWFSENDVLHLLLIAWMVYLAGVVAPQVQDARPPAGAPPCRRDAILA